MTASENRQHVYFAFISSVSRMVCCTILGRCSVNVNEERNKKERKEGREREAQRTKLEKVGKEPNSQKEVCVKMQHLS
jgi:hypothetical protein